MADEHVIKKFLVSLGFKQDDAAIKKFSDGIDRATKSVFLLATAVTASATAVAVGVERFAANMNQLYFAAMRTGTSATHIKAFQRTIQDFGGSAEDAMASIEGLTKFLRNNPGGGAMINQWLAQVGKHMTGDKGLDLASIGELFAKNTREGKAFLNDQLASKWGISSATALEIQMPGFGRAQEDISRRLAAAGFEKATKDAAAFVRQLNEMKDWLTIIGARVLDVLQVKLGWSMGKLNAYLAANGDAIANKIVRGVEIFIHLLEVLAPIVMGIIHAFEGLDKITHGWSTTIAGILVLMYAFGGFKILGGLYSLGKALVGIARGWGMIGETAAAAATAARAATVAGHFQRAEAAGAQVLAMEERALNATSKGEIIESMAAANAARAEAAAARAAGLRAAGTVVAGRGLLAGAGALVAELSGVGTAAYAGYELGDAVNTYFPNNPLAKVGVALSHGLSSYKDAVQAKHPGESGTGASGAIKSLMAMGWSAQQAAGIVANLQAESGIDANRHQMGGGPGYGIAQWEGPRQAAFAKWAGHDIHGSSREEQLRFVDYELRHGDEGSREAGRRIKSSGSAGESARYFSSLYERPAAGPAEATRRAGLAENLARGGPLLSANTTIHIASATPEAIREMERAQDRINSENVRNLKLVAF